MRLVQTNLFEVLVAVKETEKGGAVEDGAHDCAGESNGTRAQRVGAGAGRNGASQMGGSGRGREWRRRGGRWKRRERRG